MNQPLIISIKLSVEDLKKIRYGKVVQIEMGTLAGMIPIHIQISKEADKK